MDVMTGHCGPLGDVRDRRAARAQYSLYFLFDSTVKCSVFEKFGPSPLYYTYYLYGIIPLPLSALL